MIAWPDSPVPGYPIMYANVKTVLGFDQAEVRLLLESGADPFAKHDHWSVFDTRTRNPHALSESPFRNGPSIASLNAWTSDDCPPRRIVEYERKLVGPYNVPFITSMKRGDKAVVELMMNAIDWKETHLKELKDRLDRARIAATENGNLYLLPILGNHYWAKMCPCK